MSHTNAWSELHKKYAAEDWITKPSLFAETALGHFPSGGHILELGAGHGQDTKYFAEHGYSVISTDIQKETLDRAYAKLPAEFHPRVKTQALDMTQIFPFPAETFDVVYAHLSLHYFDNKTTHQIFSEITRVLKKDGILAFFVNSTDDPQYETGKKLEEDYFWIEDKPKRFFDVRTATKFAQHFKPIVADNLGETYKDSAKGVHNLIRFIGRKK